MLAGMQVEVRLPTQAGEVQPKELIDVAREFPRSQGWHGLGLQALGRGLNAHSIKEHLLPELAIEGAAPAQRAGS